MKTNSCLFCRIATKEAPSDQVGETERAYAFYDIAPKAPVHVLIVPKAHRSRPDELEADELTEMLKLARQIAEKLGVAKTGYRLVFNVGVDALQEIEHVHLHLLGGRRGGSIF